MWLGRNGWIYFIVVLKQFYVFPFWPDLVFKSCLWLVSVNIPNWQAALTCSSPYIGEMWKTCILFFISENITFQYFLNWVEGWSWCASNLIWGVFKLENFIETCQLKWERCQDNKIRNLVTAGSSQTQLSIFKTLSDAVFRLFFRSDRSLRNAYVCLPVRLS